MAKEILLLRHAKSSWDEPGQPDIDRPLSGRGRKDAKRMGQLMATRGLAPDLALCSPARRTRETLSLFEEGLGRTLEARIERSIYLAEPRALLALLRALPDDVKSVLVIGHDPGMPALALGLARGAAGPLVERIKAKFPTGALAVLRCHGEDWRTLKSGSCELCLFDVPREI